MSGGSLITRFKLGHSDVELSAGSELVLFSPDAVEGFSVCQHSCMRVTLDSLPASRKVTTPPIAGAATVLKGVDKGCVACCTLPS